MLGRSHKSDTRSRFVFPVIAVLILLISTIFLFSSRSHKAPEGKTQTAIMDMIVIPVALFSIPFRGSEKALADARERKNVVLENQKLRQQIAQLSDVRMRAEALALKVKRIEEMMSSDPGIDIPERKVPARLVSENDGPFVRSGLLNVGRSAGIEPGHAVMTQAGLYGHLVAVGKRSSRVLQLQDINSRIAVLTPRTEARAIMIGTSKDRPVLAFVADDADWREGDVVLTSGDEGVLPQGLPIGVIRAEGGRLLVDLYADTVLKDWVYVLPFSPIAPPERNADTTDADLSSEPAATVDAEAEAPGTQ